jgi:hypothetical protein
MRIVTALRARSAGSPANLARPPRERAREFGGEHRTLSPQPVHLAGVGVLLRLGQVACQVGKPLLVGAAGGGVQNRAETAAGRCGRRPACGLDQLERGYGLARTGEQRGGKLGLLTVAADDRHIGRQVHAHTQPHALLVARVWCSPLAHMPATVGVPLRECTGEPSVLTCPGDRPSRCGVR